MRYCLICMKCELNHAHEEFSIDSAHDFWKNWNHDHGEDMKCVHDYIIEEIKKKANPMKRSMTNHTISTKCKINVTHITRPGETKFKTFYKP